MGIARETSGCLVAIPTCNHSFSAPAETCSRTYPNCKSCETQVSAKWDPKTLNMGASEPESDPVYTA